MARADVRRGGGLTAKLARARDTAPDGIEDTLQIASVAWTAWESERDPEDVWPEVVADERSAEPAGGGRA